MQTARTPARHAERPAKIISFVSEREIAAVMNAAEDPFGVGGRCGFSPDGRHHAVGCCGNVVCCHCSHIFWG